MRVLVRDPEKATALARAGADITVGDLDVPARPHLTWLFTERRIEERSAAAGLATHEDGW